MLKKVCCRVSDAGNFRAISIILAIFGVGFTQCAEAHTGAGFIIFSKDRPMQLYALLESTYKYCKNVGTIDVIYHAVDDECEAGYQKVKEKFPEVCYFSQSRNNPRGDFKSLYLHALTTMPEDYVLLAVDDIIMKDDCDCAEMMRLLETTGAHAFYLRLGKNITYCYMAACDSPVPPHKMVTPHVMSWKFADGKGDWGYPQSVDMTLMKKSKVIADCHRLTFTTPNSFEGEWACRCVPVPGACGLCYETSKMINVPMNLVQSDCANRNLSSYSAAQLLEKFNQGLKIDIAAIHHMNNNSPHCEADIRFIPRD